MNAPASSGRRFRAAVLLCCVFAWAHAVAGDAVWPMLRGGPSAKGSLAWTDGPPPTLREWRFQTRSRTRYRPGLSVWASPALAVVDGAPMAFIGGFDRTLHALDLAAKEERWRRITNGAIETAPAVGEVDGMPVVWWTSSDRTLYACSAVTGAVLWTRSLVEATSTMDTASLSAPLLHDGAVHAAVFAYDRALPRSDQTAWLVRLDAASGREIWRREVEHGFVSSPVGAELDGRFIVWLAARKGILRAFVVDAGGCAPLWSYQMPHEVMGSPAAATGLDRPLVFLGSKFGNCIAVDARTGEEVWKTMAGNWIDNTVAVGEVDGEAVVFVGSHDYNVHAFRARDGSRLWRRRLGGEVFSAPAVFETDGRTRVLAASLDNHLYVLDGATGRVETSFFTGRPLWDKTVKGETLWGSPAALEAGPETCAVFGSFNTTVFSIPISKPTELRARVQSASTLWTGLLVCGGLFLGVVLPALFLLERLRARDDASS